jgi:cystathionine beta-lyase/cystathionine gamma-synthase
LLRVSVGLEDVNDLIDDFENAAKIAVAVTAGGDL